MQEKSSTFPAMLATTIRLQINVETEDRGRRENSWRCKEISVNRKQVTDSVVERRSGRGRGRGGRKDAAEVKKTKTERAASEKDKRSRWRMKATVSRQDDCGFGGGQDGLNAVRHKNNSSLPFVTQTQKAKDCVKKNKQTHTHTH